MANSCSNCGVQLQRGGDSGRETNCKGRCFLPEQIGKRAAADQMADLLVAPSWRVVVRGKEGENIADWC